MCVVGKHIYIKLHLMLTNENDNTLMKGCVYNSHVITKFHILTMNISNVFTRGRNATYKLQLCV